MSFTISVLVDLDDLDKLETAATTKLKAVGKSDSEIKEILYDGDLIQPINALTVMTDYWAGWEGCTINRVEGSDDF